MAKIIGNSVAPPTAAAVVIALLQAQVVDGKRVEWQPSPTLPEDIKEATQLLQAQVQELGVSKGQWTQAEWAAAAKTYRDQCRIAHRTRRSRKKREQAIVKHPQALDPPRRTQSPLIWEFKASCREHNLMMATAAEEMTAGLGH